MITIDIDIPKSLPSSTIKLDFADKSVIEAIIGKTSPQLPSEDHRRLASFADGYPGIARSILAAWSENIPVARATEDYIADSFVLGRIQLDQETVLKSAMLLTAFGLVGLDNSSDKQLDEVSALSDLPVEKLRVGLITLMEKGVVMSRGRKVSLEPLPIALRLAERQWTQWSPAKWEKILTGEVSPELKLNAAKQLALLNSTDIAKRVVEHVCRRNGPLDDYSKFADSPHAEVACCLAEIDARTVLDQLERTLEAFNDFSHVHGDTRRCIVWGAGENLLPSRHFRGWGNPFVKTGCS